MAGPGHAAAGAASCVVSCVAPEVRSGFSRGANTDAATATVPTAPVAIRPGVAAFHHPAPWKSSARALDAVLEAARERGEIPPGPLPERVAGLPIVLVRNELLFNGEGDGAVLDEGTLDDIIDTICLPLFTGQS